MSNNVKIRQKLVNIRIKEKYVLLEKVNATINRKKLKINKNI